MREVGGAVERIDVPAILRRSRLSAAFLGHDRVRRKVTLQAIDNQALAGAVGFGHQIVFALELEAVVVLAAPLYGGRDQRPGLASDLNCSFEKRRHAVLN